jgi:competence protein ComEC
MSELSKSKLLVLFCVFFIAGIACGFYLPSGDQNLKFYLFAAVLASVVTAVISWRQKKFRIIALTAIFLFLGMWRFSSTTHHASPVTIDYYNGQKMIIQGRIVNEPTTKKNYQKYEVRVESLVKEGKGFDPSSRRGRTPSATLDGMSGKVLVFSDQFPELGYGDRLELVCELKKPEIFSGFDYGRYLSQFDIYSVCYYPSVKVIGTKEGYSFRGLIYAARSKIRLIINRGLGEPGASIIIATLIGDSSGISTEWKNVFSYTGTSHIIAISGMHISFLIIILTRILLGLGMKRGNVFYATVLILGLYITLIGMMASAVRAGIMGFIVLLAMQSGRISKISNALFFTAAVLLYVNPKSLHSDIGFQLSFLAVMSIIYIYPIFNEWAIKRKIPELFGARDIILITVAAQILTVPIIQYNFGVVSLVSPLANLLIIPISSLILMAAVLAVALSFFLPYLNLLWFLPVKMTIDYMLFIAELANRLPFAHVQIEYKGTFWMLVYYLIIAYLIYRKNFKSIFGY